MSEHQSPAPPPDTPAGAASISATAPAGPTALSFTGGRGVRYPAPDVARGFMLLLIAIANVPWWLPSTATSAANTTLADQVLILVRSALVDGRAYPLFAALFGFGIATMTNRRLWGDWERGVPQYWAYDGATRLVRRRGWWMLLFGAIHALAFAGDIIGTYALLAAAAAGLFVTKNYRAMKWVGGGILVIGTVATVAAGALSNLMAPVADAAASGSDASTQEMIWQSGILAPLTSVVLWAVNTPLALVLSTVVPAAFIGARLADTDILANPEAHRPLLLKTAAIGLLIGAVFSLPKGLAAAGFTAAEPFWAQAVDQVAGLPGALGWLALLVLFAGNPPQGGQLSGSRRFLSEVGQRSMTAYVGQTVVFLVTFGLLTLAGAGPYLTTWLGFLIAIAAWLLIGLYCQMLASRGRRGPLEVLLRKAVARGDRPWQPPVATPLSSQQPDLPGDQH